MYAWSLVRVVGFIELGLSVCLSENFLIWAMSNVKIASICVLSDLVLTNDDFSRLLLLQN